MSSPSLLMSHGSRPPRPAGGRRRGHAGRNPSLALIFVIFYVLMIRPQQRRVKEHQAAIAAVKKGDEVSPAAAFAGA